MKTPQTAFNFKKARPGIKAYLVETKQVYGGALNYRKKKRPFHKNRAVHLILRSRLLSGSRSLTKSNRSSWVQELLKTKAKKYQAKLYKFSVNSNHIHILIRFLSPESQSQFLRDVAGSLALKIKRAFKIPQAIRVWDQRPFTSLVKSKSFRFIQKYIERNHHEATGRWAYTPRPISELVKTLERLEKRFRDPPGGLGTKHPLLKTQRPKVSLTTFGSRL